MGERMHNSEQLSQYTGISEFYDLLMKSGYYDHEGMAKAVRSIAGKNKKILELGIGTGLFAAALLDIDPSYEITGVDITPSMLTIARERLGDQVTLIDSDVLTMKIDDTFDVAVSSGGVWVIIEQEKGFVLGTHDINMEHEVQSLKNVARHLRPGGQLLLSVQKPHENFQKVLLGGIVYSQEVRTIEERPEYSCMEKRYAFKEHGEVVAKEQLHLGFYKQPVIESLMNEGGFELTSRDRSDFYVYSKKA